MNPMKLISISLSLFCLLFCLSAHAESDENNKTKDLVRLHLTVEDWAKTETAKVTVSIDANLKEDELGKMRGQIQQKLSQLAPDTEWHIIQFNRSRDQSGLEKVQAQAESRFAVNQLSGIRKKTESISKPGETYRIAQIEFKPSLTETEKTKSLLREKIYHEVIAEATRLNDAFSGLTFKLHRIDFTHDILPRPSPTMQMVQARMPEADAVFSVSDKIYLTAIVELVPN